MFFIPRKNEPSVLSENNPDVPYLSNMMHATYSEKRHKGVPKNPPYFCLGGLWRSQKSLRQYPCHNPLLPKYVSPIYVLIFLREISLILTLHLWPTPGLTSIRTISPLEVSIPIILALTNIKWKYVQPPKNSYGYSKWWFMVWKRWLRL